MAYIAIALFNQLVEGPLRDPASLNKPSTFAIPKSAALPTLPGLDVHPGILVGAVACVLCWLLIARTATGFGRAGRRRTCGCAWSTASPAPAPMARRRSAPI